MKAEDIREYFETGLGLFVKQVVSLALVVLTGGFIGSMAGAVGEIVMWPSIPPFDLLIGGVTSIPSVLFTPLVIPNMLFLGIAACRVFFYSESTSLRTWWILVAVEGFFATAGASETFFKEWPALCAAWGVWLTLTAMVITGFWFYGAWRMNRWNAELLAIEAENAQLKAEREREMIAKTLAEGEWKGA